LLAAASATDAQVAAKAADLKRVDRAALLYNWSGFYIGAHAGAAWHKDRHSALCPDAASFPVESTDSPSFGSTVPFCQLQQDPGDTSTGPDFIAFTGATAFDSKKHSFVGGLHGGYNAQLGGFVVGIETDLSVLSRGGDSQINFETFQDDGPDFDEFRGAGNVRSRFDMRWLATLRGRLGVPFGDQNRWLIYATGGLAAAHLRLNLEGNFTSSGPDSGDDRHRFVGGNGADKVLFGGTIGGGLEFLLGTNAVLRAEYLYVHFAKQNVDLRFDWDQTDAGSDPPFRHFTFTRVVNPSMHIFRGGVSWKFNP
jgi:outer membrane immunogenic protein